jgi:hypothetical protein
VGLSRLAPNGHTLCGTIRHRAPRYATRSSRVSWVVTSSSCSSCSCRVRSSCRASSCEAAKQADNNRQVTPATRCTRYQAAYGGKEQSTLVSERQRLRPGIAAFFCHGAGGTERSAVPRRVRRPSWLLPKANKQFGNSFEPGGGTTLDPKTEGRAARRDARQWLLKRLCRAEEADLLDLPRTICRTQHDSVCWKRESLRTHG